MEYVTLLNNENIWELYNGDTLEYVAADDMPIKLSELIKSHTRSTLYVYIWDLHIYLIDIIQVLTACGYRITFDNNEKDAAAGSVNYLIDEHYNPYYIDIKTSSRGTVHIYNANRATSINDARRLYEYGESASCGLYKLITELNNATGAKRKSILTLSGAARRLDSNTRRKNRAPKHANALEMNLPTGETVEAYIRPSYHGGYNYNIYNHRHKLDADYNHTKIHGAGVVLDINSSYPYIMKSLPLPYGLPRYYKGQPTARDFKSCENGSTYIYIRLAARFKLKENGIPCIRYCEEKGREYIGADFYKSAIFFNEWLEDNAPRINGRPKDTPENSDPLPLVLAWTDYKLFLENYDIIDIEYFDYIVFPAAVGIFSEYVDNFYTKKKTAQNATARRVAKMFLNGLAGSFAIRGTFENTYINNEGDALQFGIATTSAAVSYIYIGSAITAWGRYNIIKAGEKFGDAWAYCDTDSLHLIGLVDINKVDISNDKLGAFKIETTFEDICYFKNKVYLYKNENGYTLKASGASSVSRETITNALNGAAVPVPELLEDKSNGDAVAFAERINKINKKEFSEIVEFIKWTAVPIENRIHGSDFFTEMRPLIYRNLVDMSNM